jgi:hypothetical protein
LEDIKVRHRTAKEIYNDYLGEHPFSLLEKVERWIIGHSFVFMWILVVPIIELLCGIAFIPIALLILVIDLCLVTIYILGVLFVFLLSWDGQFRRNVVWYQKNVLGKRKMYLPFSSTMSALPRSYATRAIVLYGIRETADSDEERARGIVHALEHVTGFGRFGVCSSCMLSGSTLNQTTMQFRELIRDCVTNNKPFICPKCAFKNRFHTMFTVETK